MANHISALKRIKQNKKKNIRNRAVRSKLRTELKKFWLLISQKKVEEGQKQLPLIHSIIDKARTKGVINKNLSSRKKSQVHSWLQELLASTNKVN